MDIIELLFKEPTAESRITKKFLAIVPVDDFDWAPHQKSMNIKALATLIAELPAG